MKPAYRGWLLFCPIYLSDLDGEVEIRERHWSLTPVYHLANAVLHVFYLPLTLARGEVPPLPLLVTGRVDG